MTETAKAEPTRRWVVWVLVGVLLASVGLSLLLPANRAPSVLTAVLVGVTAWYAWQTQQMAKEMRAARGAQVIPKLLPTIRRIGGGHVLPRISNAGVGPAINIRVTLAFEPAGPSVDYVSKLLSPGRSQSFMLPTVAGQDYVDHIDKFAAFQRLRLTGTYTDALGGSLSVDERLDLAEYVAAFKADLWTYGVKKKSGDPMDVIAESLVNIENHMRRMIEAD